MEDPEREREEHRVRSATDRVGTEATPLRGASEQEELSGKGDTVPTSEVGNSGRPYTGPHKTATGGVNALHNVLLVVLALVAIFILIGCGASSTSSQYGGGESPEPAPPSEDDARQVLEDAYREGPGFIDPNIATVQSLRKTNGQMGEESGVPIYDLYYEAELECLQDGYEIVDSDAHCSSEGEIVSIDGIIRFEQTENGWIGRLQS